MFDLTNSHGRDGDILAKAKLFSDWEIERTERQFHTYRRVLLTSPDRVVTARDPFDNQNPKDFLFFGGNGYLNLSTHPRLIEESYAATKKWGTSACASSVIGGKSLLHEEVERKLANFLGMESSFIFPSGYSANDSVISALARPGDIVFGDSANHLSIALPCKAIEALSKGKIEYKTFDTNSSTLLPLLETKNHKGGKILITDGVFSMDGTVADLTKISQECSNTKTLLIVDDAHGVGVLGLNGSGSSEHCSISPDIITGSCAKALGSVGGFVAGSNDVIKFIEGTSTSAIYSTYQNTGALGALSAAIDLISNEPELRSTLLANSKYLKDGLISIGAATTDTITGIVPVLFDDADQAFFFSHFLHTNGIYTNTIFPPAVKQPRARLSVCTNHRKDDLDRVIELFQQGLDKYKRDYSECGKMYLES